jgi:hypothetical protein
MLPKVVFVKQSLSNLKLVITLSKKIQNYQKPIGKSIPVYRFLKSQEEKTVQSKSLQTFAKSL